MKSNKILVIILLLFLFLLPCSITFGQNLNLVSTNGISIRKAITETGDTITLKKGLPLFSVLIDKTECYSSPTDTVIREGRKFFRLKDSILYSFAIDSTLKKGIKYAVTFFNYDSDTVVLENVLPFGRAKNSTYITGTGPWNLARTKLFRPGLSPIGVILPDNAWEMGYSSIPLNDNASFCGIARRKEIDKAQKRRYETHLFPGGSVTYNFYFDAFTGDWQNGLKLMFHDHYLYDLDQFNDTLFKRKDLSWIRKSYLIVLQFAWDHEFFDEQAGGYHVKEFLESGKKYLGGYDVYGIWPTWPTLGIDERNQWDLYRDLPGGLSQLKSFSEWAKSNGTRFFIAYNPWDQSTRKEDPYKGMAQLIKDADADGVVLDTRGSSSEALQRAADSIKPGVIMYSEGMAVTKDMPGIIAGRVHDAIFMPPPLNMNKLIRPDFAIFRVCQLSQGPIHREVAISLFNGYGIELNTMAPGRPEWMHEEYIYLGKVIKILRENSSCFNSSSWTPLINTLKDSIWVNKFPAKQKTMYTVYSLVPAGFNEPLFEVQPEKATHFVSLWHHEMLTPVMMNGKKFIPANTDAFDKSYLKTRREGSVDCIAAFQNFLQVEKRDDSLFVKTKVGNKILVWKGNPAYEKTPVIFDKKELQLNLYELFGRFEGKIVVQLFDTDELLDEQIIYRKSGAPVLISKHIPTEKAKTVPDGMVEIPKGQIIIYPEIPSDFIHYPEYDSTKPIPIPRFYVDKYPVTNNEFYTFIESTGYKPTDTANYLKNWENGKFPRKLKNYPVVYISYEDAQAYAKWAGKRLPTEAEWLYAAQGNDGSLFPWGNEPDSTKCNYKSGELSGVSQHPDGASPFGAEDLTGNVWQLTNDLYDDGSFYFIIMRGGSYYNPTSSWWYVTGGPQPLNKTQMLLRVSQGFERNATVGFRCVKDAQ